MAAKKRTLPAGVRTYHGEQGSKKSQPKAEATKQKEESPTTQKASE